MKKRYTLEQKKWDSPAEHAMPEHTRVPASFSIGNVRIAPATVLAPMAGVTDTVFRRFIKNASQFPASAKQSTTRTSRYRSPTNQQSGCGLIMTEFTSADGLSRMREVKRKRYLTYYDDEHPISAQLFGSNPETLADSARIVQDAGFDLVDLNLGCPAKRVVACNGGSRPAARPAADRAHLQGHPRGGHHPVHGQVPHGLERQAHRLRRTRDAWPKTAA